MTTVEKLQLETDFLIILGRIQQNISDFIIREAIYKIYVLRTMKVLFDKVVSIRI